MNEEDKLIRAREAESLLNNPLLRAAFDDVRTKLVEQIEQCNIKDDVLRDKLMLSLQLVKRIKGVLTDHINTGKITSNVLNKRSMFNREGM